ncbi:hypothetical protein CHS0354_020062 [Potamilus streckersoni]|uniref:MIB/HERC2 domain-containing protein n=1 Tax=Potamilus streckersoni TaxID=2493646 RepID=A0AAE0SCI4_9BIVA|nr:hypothetical protein CHS0354_020062 [Potamilus streckersoni]
MIAILFLFLMPVLSLEVLQEQGDQIATLSQRLDRLTDELNKERSQKHMQYNSLAGQIISLRHELADEKILRRTISDKLASLQDAGMLEHGVGNTTLREDITQIEAIKQIQRNLSELNDKYAKLEKDPQFILWGDHGGSKDFNTFSFKFASKFESLGKGFRALKEQSYKYADRIEDLEKSMNVVSSNLKEYQTKTGGNEKLMNDTIRDIKKMFLSILDLDTKVDRVMQMRTTVISSSSSLTTVRPGNSSSSGAQLAAILKQGMRVVRGQDWQWGNQDGNQPGTVLTIRDDGWVRVKWDAGNENNYRMHDGKYDLSLYIPKDVKSGSKIAANLKPGMRVVRGVDRKWEDQDGDPPKPGTVKLVHDSGWVRE